MPRKLRSLRCPACRKLVLRGDAEFPFCSERCRLIDLGKWASGGYVISTPIQEADQFGEGAGAAVPQQDPNHKVAAMPQPHVRNAKRS